MSIKEIIGLVVAGVIFAIVLAVVLLLKLIDVAEAIQIIITFVLVLVTVVYVKRTADIAKATKEQAEASVKMAEETRAQRIMTSRPIVIVKAINDDQESYFEIYNTGSGTALEVEVVLLDQHRQPLYGEREGFLRAGELPMKFYPSLPPNLQNFYVAVEYQGISSRSPQPTWYQTWLPCKLSVTGKVISGKLKFFDEVYEGSRIGIFRSEFDNGVNQND